MLAYKIKVDVEDSLNVILSYVQASKHERIILEIPEGNDILRSLVGLKTLHTKFLQIKKQVILLLPDQKSKELATKAGFIAVTDEGEISVNHWKALKEEIAKFEAESIKPASIKIDAKKVIVPTVKTKAKALTSLERSKKPDLTGVDLAKIVKSEVVEKTKSVEETAAPSSYRPKIRKRDSEFIEHTRNKRKQFWLGLVKLLVFIIGITGFFGAIGLYFYYKYVPRVYVTLKVKKTKVALESTVIASTAVTGFDIEKLQIPLLQEEIKKQGSTTIKATEEVTDGSYATGLIHVNNNDTQVVSLPTGTVFVSDNGLEFKSTADVTINPGEGADVSVQASQYGEEYNLEAGHTFTISGVSGNLTAANTAAFSGGSKRTYTVVGKKDVEKGVKELKKSLFDEALDELKTLNVDKGYVFIESSVKNELDGDYKVDPPIGTEAQDAYLEVHTKSSALYYHKDSLEELIEQVMLNKYRKKFNIGADALLEINNLDVKITKISISKDRNKATLLVKATGEVIPKIDTEVLKQQLVGKSWSDAVNYLNALPYLRETPIVKFEPSWIPQNLWYIPQQTTRISIIVQL